ncbi:MAG TPA: YdeI/OmpD-associated family protein [Terriglobia bacterium]|nr:YdeI/OmpD-associated family protein [Terriglobia bacterium]
METVYCPDEQSWRNWLASHHDSSREIWLLFPKKHTGKPCVSYSDALDEGLCYGWIDSLIKRIDDDWYARKFTPRTDNRKWSEINKKRAARLIKDGRMMPVGIAKFRSENGSASAAPPPRPELPSTVPPFISRHLKRNARAWENFKNLAPSHKRRYVGWIMFAKRDETRQKRLKEATALLAANQKLGLK